MLGTTFEFLGQSHDVADWVLGENMNGTPGRSMIDPHAYNQPDYYGTSDPYWYDITFCIPSQENDFCGVHTNSGVGNKWFYLLSEGGLHHGITVNGIGIGNAINIAYDANAYEWIPWSDYHDGAEGTYWSAKSLDPFGDNGWAKQTACAWHAVGVIIDSDGDGVGDCLDNCPDDPNSDQANHDGDSHGDACDNCDYANNEDQADGDGDGHGDVCDNCPGTHNPGQENNDSDTYGNACDNCPDDTNQDQANSDNDSHGNVCDNCPNDDNEDQSDRDLDDHGDICDNCPDVYNPDQSVPDEWSGVYGDDGANNAVYASIVNDTTFGADYETVSADINDGPLSRTITVAQNVSYDLYMPIGLCDTYNYTEIKLNGGIVARLYCEGSVSSETGSFAVVPGDIVTAYVDGFIPKGDPEKVPPAHAEFTHYTVFPTSVEVNSFMIAGQTSPLSTQVPEVVHATLSSGPISRIMPTAQNVSYDVYIPLGLCQTYDYSEIKHNGQIVVRLYCDGSQESATGSFAVAAGDEVRAYVSGFLPGRGDPDKVPPGYADFSFYDLIPGPADFQVVKTDICGGEEWTVTHGTANDDQAKDARLTSDKGTVVAGYTGNGSDNDFYVVKFAENGSYSWERTYNNSITDRAASICELEFGGYVILGTTDVGGTSDLLLIRTDASGNEQWRQTYGVTGVDDLAGDVKQTSDGGFILAGSTGPNLYDWNVYLVKTNSSGTETWNSVLGLSNVDEYGFGVEQTSDGGYIITGQTDWMGTVDALLIKTNSAGIEEWHQAYVGDGVDIGYDIMIDADGNYVIGGKSSTSSLGGDDFYVMKADATGNLLWGTTFGGAADDYALSVTPTLAGGYLLGGSTESFGAGYTDFYVVNFVNPPPAPPTLISPADNYTWRTYGSIQVTLDWGDVPTADQYHVMLDNNSDFSSPIVDNENLLVTNYTTSYLGWATYYWKVRALNETGWGPWSERRHFHIYKKSTSSCPYLYSFDGVEFKEQDVLLTACEKSGFANVVTDYYHLNSKIEPLDGQIRFQIRELEEEITYLHGVELITVDHSPETKVACGVDGEISTYAQTVAPLTAVDQNGIDRMEELSSVDGNVFKATGSGHLIVTFPNTEGDEFGYQMSAEQKPKPCEPVEDDPLELKVSPDTDKRMYQLTVEILDNGGNWVELSSPPARDRASDEIVFSDIAGHIEGEVVTLRLSWQKGYATDAIGQIIPSEETPSVKTLRADDFNLMLAKPSPGDWNGFVNNQPLVMTTGDIIEFGFVVDPPADPGLVRDYIIRAVGRYEPGSTLSGNQIPNQYQLYSNYPNPFNPLTKISYDLPEASHTKLEIFNVLGQQVATLIDEYLEAGHYQIIWEARDDNGNQVASGIYFYRLSTETFVGSKKMVLLK